MQNSLENTYSNFNETDFINDPYFQAWVIGGTEEMDLFWNGFLKSYPGKAEAVQAARHLLQSLQFAEDIPDDEYVHKHYLEHIQQISEHDSRPVATNRFKVFRSIMAAAAVVAATILVVATIFYLKKSRVEQMVVATKFGEMKRVVLPDSTVVILNAHSRLAYAKDWGEGRDREVWLDGEAFLDVKHVRSRKPGIVADEKFLVRGEGYLIEVLGTMFDVRQRRGKTEVVLQAGKIKLTLKDRKEPIILLPGDLVSYIPATKSIEKSIAVPENYSGWKEKKLLLNNPTLQEITNYLEDNYGKKIIIETSGIENKKIEGMIELSNLQDALFIISTVLNTEIEKREDYIIIRSK